MQTSTKVILLIAFLALLGGVIFSQKGSDNEGQDLRGEFGSSVYASASTTAWSIGPQESKTIVPARGSRGCLILSNNGVRDVYYRFDSTAATQSNGILLTASSTIVYGETVPYTGAVTAMAVTASTTLLVTECIY